MRRSRESEIIDDPSLPESELERAHRDLTRTHRWLGNTAVILAALKHDPFPVGRVLDIGCGHGGLLLEIRKRLGAEIVGVDLRTPSAAPVPMVRADAVREAGPVQGARNQASVLGTPGSAPASTAAGRRLTIGAVIPCTLGDAACSSAEGAPARARRAPRDRHPRSERGRRTPNCSV